MSVNISFPPNPEDGMIFELIPGIYYKYDSGSNCWARIKGVESLGLATPLSDGLMSKDDYNKLQNLLVPPLQTSLKGEECNSPFTSGKIALYSSDGLINISNSLRTIGVDTSTNTPWQLHKNTAGFDFRVSLDNLINEIDSRSRYKKIQLQGDKGYKGPQGQPGRDRLDTGPVGIDGLPGANSPFDGRLVVEQIPFEMHKDFDNKAIVDVTTEEISADENYLVVTRANIGNPDACPSEVSPKNFNSTLVVAIDDSQSSSIKNHLFQSNNGSLTCRVCGSNIYHFDLSNIVNSIYEHFILRVERLKVEKESLVRSWLNTMISLFAEQKAALCCALENCRSRKRNERIRQYVETQRIQAANQNLSIVIDGDIGSRQYIDMNEGKSCSNIGAIVGSPSVTSSTLSPRVTTGLTSTIRPDGNDLIVSLNAKFHTSNVKADNNSAVRVILQAGSYTVSIEECCANFNTNFGQSSYSGQVAIKYKAQYTSPTGSLVSSDEILTFPNFGAFSTEAAAKDAYQGVTLTLHHNGGEVLFWLIDPDGLSTNNEGGVQLRISPNTSGAPPVTTSNTNVYRDNISSDKFLGDVEVYTGTISAYDNLKDLNTPLQGIVHGPSLAPAKAQLFFYDGSDGLSLFFVVDEPNNNGGKEVVVEITVINNSYNVSVKASVNAVVDKIFNNKYKVTLDISNDAAGVAFGPIDVNSEYSIDVNIIEYSSIALLTVASYNSTEVIVSEGGTEGLGGHIAHNKIGALAVYSLLEASSEFEAGPGLRIENGSGGEPVYVDRPIYYTIPEEYKSELATGESLENIPGCDVRGVPGTKQDPSINNITTSIRTTGPQNIRYILTDKDGVKFYSAYVTNDISKLTKFQLLDFGPPITILAPPPEFTPEIIASKTVDVNIVADKLTSDQIKIAESLNGLSRLTYIQSIIGSPVDIIPDINNMSDIEFELKNMPISTFDINSVVAKVGLPGATIDVTIDDFSVGELVSGNPNVVTSTINGKIKRIVNSFSGNSSGDTGFITTGLTSYFGDYFGVNSLDGSSLDFNGNHFFTYNIVNGGVFEFSGVGRVGYIKPSVNEPPFEIVGNVNHNSMVVSSFGIIYIANGSTGEVVALMSSDSQNNLVNYSDVDVNGSNIQRVIASGLPTGKAVITIGKTKIVNNQIIEELIVNFNDEWFIVDGNPIVVQNNPNAIRDDVDTIRCCFGGNKPTKFRAVAIADGNFNVVSIGKGIAGDSITTDKPINPQLSLPISSDNLNTDVSLAIQAELDRDYNQFNLYALDGDTVYLVDQNTGNRTVYKELGELAFDLCAHPRTKDLYYVVNDGGTDPFSGTIIRRIDIDDLDSNDIPKIKTVYDITNDTNTDTLSTKLFPQNTKIFGITFGAIVPTDPTLSDHALYALTSDYVSVDPNKGILTQVIEIAERIAPPKLDHPLSREIPVNSVWTSSIGSSPNNNADKVILSGIAPGTGCQMHYKQVQWYERGWRIGACCGALVQVSGTWYIVVKRSIGIDTTCGGGESLNNPCIAQFIDNGDGHPAIAWPTFVLTDSYPNNTGEEFLGLPSSGFVNFIKDSTLSNAILNQIKSGNALKIFGDPANEIPFILFPAP